MATMMVKIANGNFENFGKNFELNGYEGHIRPDKSIEIVRTAGNQGVYFHMSPDGHYTMNNRGDIRRGQYQLDESGHLNGVFGLHTSTGKKYLYFREESFQRWLDLHGITAVKKEDPNRVFYGSSADNARGEMRFSIDTDGKTEASWTSSCEGTVLDREVTVSGATWVVVHKFANYGDKHHSEDILYTLEDVTSLSGLPVIRKFRNAGKELSYSVFPNGEYRKKWQGSGWRDALSDNFQKEVEEITSLGYKEEI